MIAVAPGQRTKSAMSPLKSLTVASTLVILAPTLSAAAERTVELAPMIGLRGGDSFESHASGSPSADANPAMSYGLGVNVYLRSDAWIGVFVDHQTLRFTTDPDVFGVSRFDFTVDYLQFAGGYEPPEGKVQPFVTASLGLTHYGAETGTVTRTTGLSGSLGGGFKWPIGKRMAFRVELRGYATANDTAVSVTCGPGCSVQFESSGWYQLAASAGIAIRL